MSLPNITFIPLYPGEAPGDPELGGWRPLPKHFYSCHEQVILSQVILSLEEVVRLVAFRLHEFQLRQAVGIVAQRLAI